MEKLRYSNDFGVKIYNRLVKQYPQIASEGQKGGKSSGFSKKGKLEPSGMGRGIGALPSSKRGGKMNSGQISGTHKKKEKSGSFIGGPPKDLIY